MEDLTGKRVLLVEDSATASQMITATLNSVGLQVDHADTGPTALELAQRSNPNCILLDVELPGGMSGFEICAALSELDLPLLPPVIFITAKEGDDNKRRALALGAYGFLVKPFEEPELIARVTGALRIQSLQIELAEARSQIDRMSRIDPVTGALNRTHLAEALGHACSVADRYGRPLSILLGDIDHLRVINDRLGLVAGDRILRRFSALMAQACRDADTAGRFGSGEFLVICPETDVGGASVLAGRIRAGTEATVGTDITSAPVTASFGCAEQAPGEGAEHLLSRCGAALEAAKFGGRNRVCIASRPSANSEPHSDSSA
ncbi:MAG: hypothetical protein DCC49_01405 [Acidobacteria bacterium]|nr:MAG: hypothetical protein DCC49_01405 [Acidobacteriota bacterium]